MEQAPPANETHLKKIIELQNEIIKFQNIIIEKNTIIEKDKEIIKDLQNKLKKEQQEFITSKPIPIPITPNKKFNILEKQVTHQENQIKTIYILQDGRIAAGDEKGNIIIYNKYNFKPEMTIKESACIMYITQFKNGSLVSLLDNGYINIHNLLDNNKYLTLQTIKAYYSCVHKLIVLDNDDNRFMTYSDDKTIKCFIKDNKEYKEDYSFKDDGTNINNLLVTREGEIVYSGFDSMGYSYIKFYDLKLKTILSSIKTQTQTYGLTDNLYKLNDTLLLVGAYNSILIVDVYQRRQIKEIEINNYITITSFLKWDEKILLTGDSNGNIKQWIIDNDNLILENEKNKAHNLQIRMIRKNQEGFLITCSDDAILKIWS